MPHNLLELSGEVCVEEPVENWVAAGAGHAHHVGDAVRQHHVLYNIVFFKYALNLLYFHIMSK